MITVFVALAATSIDAETAELLRSCNRPTPAAIVSCYARKQAEVDAQLDKLFAWERTYSAPYGDQHKAAQEAWRAWREAQCSAEVAEEAAAHAWGEGTGYSECAIGLALQRTRDLQRQKHAVRADD